MSEETKNAIERLEFDYNTLNLLMKNYQGEPIGNTWIDQWYLDRYFHLMSSYSSMREIFVKFNVKKPVFAVKSQFENLLSIQNVIESDTDPIETLIKHFLFLSRNDMVFYHGNTFSSNFENFELVALSCIHGFSTNKDNFCSLKFDVPFLEWISEKPFTLTCTTRKEENIIEIKKFERAEVFQNFTDIMKVLTTSLSPRSSPVIMWEFKLQSNFNLKNDHVVNLYLAACFRKAGWIKAFTNCTISNIKVKGKETRIGWEPEIDVLCMNEKEVLLIETKRRSPSTKQKIEKRDAFRFLSKFLVLRDIMTDFSVYGIYFSSGTVGKIKSIQDNVPNFYIIDRETTIDDLKEKFSFPCPFT